VIKPSEMVPLVGETLRKCLAAGGEPDVALVVQGAGATGAALINAKPDKIVFTGGVATGRRIMEAASKHLIPVVLELGGKDPMIVASDANLPAASDGAVWGCFTNSGQVCASVKRIYVMEEVADRFIDSVVRKTKALRIGDPQDPNTEIGAMTTEAQIATVERQVREAVAEGARVLCGGRRLTQRAGRYFEPTVLGDVNQTMKVMHEEIFGPVLPIMKVKSEEEAVRFANDSDLGLCASVWTRNISKGEALAAQIEAGTVTVNECTYTHGLGETPWGGIKQSGFGRTHSKIGLHEFVYPHHINTNLRPKTRSIWWFPYGDRSLAMARAMIEASFGKSPLDRWRGLRSLLKNFSFSMLKPRP
jgi:succinate-semialdehyde dehydrogenase/glutarate-semialdehyde dehydrogenase